MKKIVISFVILFSILLVVGFTTNKGSYKPGTYYGYDIDISNKFENEARATVYIDDKGIIKSVSLDTTYPISHLMDNTTWYEYLEKIENDVNKSLNPQNSVIATGGSAIYGKEAMEHFDSIGTVVYLNLPYEEIEQRLGNLEERGVTIKKGQTLKDLYNERTPLYKKYANLTIDCQGKTIREIVEEISANSNIQEN